MVQLRKDLLIAALFKWCSVALFGALLTRSVPDFFENHRMETLLSISYELIVLVCFLRLNIKRDHDVRLSTLAIVTSHMMLPLLFEITKTTSIQEIVGTLFAIAGLAWAAISLVDLGKSFDVLASHFETQTKGNYSLLRHPAYAGYLLSAFGVWIASPSLKNSLVIVAYIALTILRISREENILAKSCSGYRAYKLQVKYRLIPGVF